MNSEIYDVEHDTGSDTDSSSNIFKDPPGFYPPIPPCTSETYTFKSGQEIEVSLVGHSPLWGHHLWNAGWVMSRFLEAHDDLVRTHTVLELGAGAGLPSLVCAHLGAECVVVTDYPDSNLIRNLKHNVENFYEQTKAKHVGGVKGCLAVEGYCWGADCQTLLNHLPLRDGELPGFDILIMADLLFNHSEHKKLLETLEKTLKKHESAKALVFFTPYRPWLLDKDLAFFDMLPSAGMESEKIFEKKMDKVMFEDDQGDQELRKTVFGYIVKWIL